MVRPEDQQPSCSKQPPPRGVETADKLVGPPVYEGLTQAAVLLQVHTKLAALEDENQKMADTIKELQRAVRFLLSGRVTPPSTSQPDIRAQALSQSSTPPSDCTRPIILPGHFSTNGKTHTSLRKTQKPKPDRQIAPIYHCPPQAIHMRPASAPASIASRRSKTLLNRAMTSSIVLQRGQDPVVQSHQGARPGDHYPVRPGFQVKYYADGSIRQRVRNPPIKTSKGTKQVSFQQQQVVFQPPPLHLAETPSSTSVSAPRPNQPMACPDDPFSKLLLRQ